MMKGNVVMEEDKVGARKRCGILEMVQYPGGWKNGSHDARPLLSLTHPSTGVWNAVGRGHQPQIQWLATPCITISNLVSY